jgi:hypothetical protein
MKEIILRTDRAEGESVLPLLLRQLFPECKVTVLPVDQEARNEYEWREENHGPNSHCR